MLIVYPATYQTASTANSDLKGSMTMSDAETVSSYDSDAWGAATGIHMQKGGTGLHFKVTFTEGKSTKQYEIKAQKENNGKDYKGDSVGVSPGPEEEWGTDDWTGTETGPEPPSY